MGRHCATKINETHVLITGGFNIDGKTYFVDTRGTVISKRIHIVEKNFVKPIESISNNFDFMGFLSFPYRVGL